LSLKTAGVKALDSSNFIKLYVVSVLGSWIFVILTKEALFFNLS